MRAASKQKRTRGRQKPKAETGKCRNLIYAHGLRAGIQSAKGEHVQGNAPLKPEWFSTIIPAEARTHLMAFGEKTTSGTESTAKESQAQTPPKARCPTWALRRWQQPACSRGGAGGLWGPFRANRAMVVWFSPRGQWAWRSSAWH